MRNTLILAYYSIKDPVFQGAVLPYFIDFPNKDLHFTLVTYEHSNYKLTANEISSLSTYLNSHNISWLRLSWNSGKLKLVKKLYDMFRSIVILRGVILKKKCEYIYSEGFPGAIIGHYLTLLTKAKHLIHTFEPHANYMLESGVWTRNSWEFLLLKKLEKKIALRASHIFTATNGMINVIESWGVDRRRLHRVPSCIDLERFKFDNDSRLKIRQEMGLSKTDLLVVYLGKIGGMYMDEEIFEFYKLLSESKSLRCKFLFVTPQPIKLFEKRIEMNGLDKSLISIINVTHKEVPSYLSASDFGFVAVRQRPSKVFCSPIKTGEYMACGLPVIVPKGISDDFYVMKELGIAIVLERPSHEGYEKVREELEEFWASKTESTRVECRKYAKENRNVAKAKELYERIM